MTRMHFRRSLAPMLAGLVLAAPLDAFAQVGPDKPMRIMVGASPGGGTDILARMLADKFAPSLKQSVVVENRPGASNTIAADMTAHAVPSPTAARCCWPPTPARPWHRTCSNSNTTRSRTCSRSGWWR